MSDARAVSTPETSLPESVPASLPDKDAPLRQDIRLLGRILGDTVRAHEGAAIFDLIERIRQTSIRFHRDGDAAARRELEELLDARDPYETIQIVRAYSFFSHLAN